MIKNITIIILMLLLVISIYSYYCLSNSMITYENERMNYINEKECELNARDHDIRSVTSCQNQNSSYESAIDNILDLAQKGSPKNIVCKSSNAIEQQIETSIDSDRENEQEIRIKKEQEKEDDELDDSDDSDDSDSSKTENNGNKMNAIDSEATENGIEAKVKKCKKK